MVIISSALKKYGSLSMSHYKKIAVLENEVQAQLLDTVLTERCIPHIIRSYYDRAYDGLFQFHKGWGHVEAPEDFETEILNSLEELSEQQLNAGENQTSQKPDEDLS